MITLEPCRDSQLHPALEEMSGLDFALRPCLCLPILRMRYEYLRRKRSAGRSARFGQRFRDSRELVPEGIVETRRGEGAIRLWVSVPTRRRSSRR